MSTDTFGLPEMHSYSLLAAEAARLGGKVHLMPETVIRYEATVAELVRALEDTSDVLTDAMKRSKDTTDEERDIMDNARSLLAAVKGAK